CQGNAAMMEQWPYLGTLAEMDGSAVAGKVAAAVTPGSSPTLGGWALAIVNDTQDPELAFKFCEFATSADGECLKIQYEMDPCRTANYSRDVVKDFSDKYEAFMQNLAVATQLADTDIPYISAECGDIEEIAIQAALSGELTAAEAIDQMAEQLQEVINGFKEDEGL
ncbi:MAG: extracellular solute-binding protein, partial [Bacillota bacterium]